MNLKYTPVIALFFILISFINSKAQCPTIKKTSSENNTITVNLSSTTKYTAAILYNVENSQPYLNLDAKTEIKNNSILFNNLPQGNYIVRINEKGCKPLFIGKEQNISIK